MVYICKMKGTTKAQKPDYDQLLINSKHIKLQLLTVNGIGNKRFIQWILSQQLLCHSIVHGILQFCELKMA